MDSEQDVSGRLANRWRQGDTHRLEDLSRDAGNLCPKDEALAVLVDLSLLKTLEITHHLGPFHRLSLSLGQPILERLTQDEGEKRAEDVASNRLVRSAHFVVRHLDRLPLGTAYPSIVERIDDIAIAVQRRIGTAPTVYVDATGVGQPVVDLLRERMGGTRPLVAVTFTWGQRYQLSPGIPSRLTLGKEFLACRLQALLASRRIHLPSTAEGRALAAELRNYELRVDQGGHARFGAFRAGTHDDLATALGLAVANEQCAIRGRNRKLTQFTEVSMAIVIRREARFETWLFQIAANLYRNGHRNRSAARPHCNLRSRDGDA